MVSKNWTACWLQVRNYGTQSYQNVQPNAQFNKFLKTCQILNNFINIISFYTFLLSLPAPPAGTKLTFGSLPAFSLFKLGIFTGGGTRRPGATLPRLWRPYLGAEAT